MGGNRQLAWIQRNRSRRSGITCVGDLLTRLVKDAEVGRDCTLDTIVSVLAACTDEEFWRCCRIGCLQQGRLTIHVDQPAMVYYMRAKWLPMLRKRLLSLPTRPIKNISFAWGRHTGPS